MAWRRPGDKPLSEPMLVSLLTHICVTRPQWVNHWWLNGSLGTNFSEILFKMYKRYSMTCIWNVVCLLSAILLRPPCDNEFRLVSFYPSLLLVRQLVQADWMGFYGFTIIHYVASIKHTFFYPWSILACGYYTILSLLVFVLCVCVYVCRPQFAHMITNHPFQVGPSNLDQRYKTAWLIGMKWYTLAMIRYVSQYIVHDTIRSTTHLFLVEMQRPTIWPVIRSTALYLLLLPAQ